MNSFRKHPQGAAKLRVVGFIGAFGVTCFVLGALFGGKFHYVAWDLPRPCGSTPEIFPHLALHVQVFFLTDSSLGSA